MFGGFLSGSFGEEVAGTVTDDLGRPIEGAEIRLSHRGWDARTTSDADGVYRIPDAPPGQYELRISAERHTSLTPDVTVWPGQALRRDVRLDRVCYVTGRITLRSGEPLRNAEVGVRFRQGPGRGRGWPVTTGPDGTYRAWCRPPGRYVIDVKAPGYARVTIPGVRVVHGEDVAGIDVALEAPAGSIAGVVYEPDGVTPRAGAYVWAKELRADGRERLSGGLGLMLDGRPSGISRFSRDPNTTAGPDGQFLLPDVADGTYRVYAQAMGYAASAAEPDTAVGRSQKVTGVRVVLRAAAWLSGVVIGTDGRPLANTSLRVDLSHSRDEGFSGSAGFGLTTDEQGRYSIGPLEPGSYELHLSAKGLGAAVGRARIAGAEQLADCDLRLGTGATLTVRVIGPDGEPASGAEAMLWRKVGTSRHGGPTLTVDERGDVRFEGLLDGTYEVTVKSATAAPGSTDDIAIRDGTAPDVFIQLREGATIVGRVVDDEGTPVSGARVTAYCREPDGIGRVSPIWRDSPALITDDEGRFVMGRLVAGEWSVSAEARGHLRQSAQAPVGNEGEHEVQIVLPRAWSGTLRGQLFAADGETPVAHTLLIVELLVRRDDEFRRIEMAEAHTDDEGRFGVQVDKGIHAVKVMPTGWLPSTVELQPSDRDTETLTLQTLPPAGVRGTLQLGDATIPPAGLYVLAVRPGEDADVDDLVRGELDYEQGLAKVMPGETEWEITGLEIGDFDVFTYAPEVPPSIPKRVQVMSGETAEVVVDVALPGGVSGRVVTAGGIPLAGARVYAYPSGGGVKSQRWRTETDEQGRFELDGLTPGPARVRAFATGYASSPSNRVTIVALDMLQDVDFEMVAGGKIAGAVRRRDGRPLLGMYRVRLELEPERYRTAYTEADGTFGIERVYPGTYRLLLQTRETRETIAEKDGVSVVEGETTGGVECLSEESCWAGG
ncbi:MAG: carboxypeptidase regulatory-like domain-containing protein, partial [Armatimonadota bacterium]